MSDLTTAADSMAASEEPNAPSPAEAQDAVDSGEAEGTTPEEVAQVLRSSGINLPAEPKAAPVDEVDEEEGDDPTAADEDDSDTAGEGKDTEEVANEEPIKPETKPADTAATDEATDTSSEKYAFEVTDANDVTFKITPDAKMEDILAEFEPKNNGQILDILEQLREAKATQKADQEEAAKAEEDSARNERVSKIQDDWNSEIKDLQAHKRLPSDDNAEKRTNEVYEFMAKENDARIKAGKPTIGSFEDALDKLENKEARDAKVQAARDAKDAARKNGSLVGGSSAPATNSSVVYKAGSARNANQAIAAMGLLK